MIGANDLDYLNARLHGSRARMAEGARLDALCALGSVRELAAEMLPGAAVLSSVDLQARLAEATARELADLGRGLGGARGRYIAWLAARFRAENIKTAVRAILSGTVTEAAGQWIKLPEAGYGLALLSAKTLEELAELLPEGPLREGLKRACEIYFIRDSSFFYEAEIDLAYFKELLARAGALSGPDRKAARNLAGAELEIFLLALAARAKAYYGIGGKELSGFYLEGSGISSRRFLRLLEAPEEPGGQEPSATEAAAWTAYARLADRVFRRSNIDFGVAAGYAALRRVEAANLVTVSEGLRLGVPPEALRARVLRTRERETADV